MTTYDDQGVHVTGAAPTLPDGVVALSSLAPVQLDGCAVFLHYNGPTGQLSGVCTGMVVLEPGARPHPVHQHPEEEFLIIAEGTGEIECAGRVIPAGPGAIMYCASNTPHGITNTGSVPMTFYWSKWTARGC